MVRLRSQRYVRVLGCPYCGKAMDPSLRPHHPKYPTKDHVLPKSRGGGWIVICCSSCNGHKADNTIDEWHDILREKGDPRAALVETFINMNPRSVAEARKRDTGRVQVVQEEVDDWRAVVLNIAAESV